MGVEMLGNFLDIINGPLIDETMEELMPAGIGIDARRRLEDKIEDMRLRREMQEYGFDL
ncbi:MAG: hypothetical protein ACI9Y1_003675 [Lentisphaeria bacterium]|jgi:hypothetical protein